MSSQFKTIQKSFIQLNDWLEEMREIYDFEQEEHAFLLLRATLKALRDRLSTEEVISLGNILPAILRGFYYEGWKPEENKSETFTRSVISHLGGIREIDLEMTIPETLKIIYGRLNQSNQAIQQIEV
jgi:uncharacterized protein (DUF2267 family)